MFYGLNRYSLFTVRRQADIVSAAALSQGNHAEKQYSGLTGRQQRGRTAGEISAGYVFRLVCDPEDYRHVWTGNCCIPGGDYGFGPEQYPVIPDFSLVAFGLWGIRREKTFGAAGGGSAEQTGVLHRERTGGVAIRRSAG